MKILSATQIKSCDIATTESGVSSLNLMERAAAKCVEWIEMNFKTTNRFLIFRGGR